MSSPASEDSSNSFVWPADAVGSAADAAGAGVSNGLAAYVLCGKDVGLDAWCSDVVDLAWALGVVSVALSGPMVVLLIQTYPVYTYLSVGWAGTAAHRQRADVIHGKARMPLSFWKASGNSFAMTSPTLNLYPVIMALINTSLVRSMV
ncbi:hypothetical protein V6N13_104274 [Hibiscus sabdariffa]